MKAYKSMFKVFLVTEDQKEEKWLREMSLKGYHLVNVTGGTRYRFEIGEPKDYTYLLDFKGWGSIADKEYIEVFEDAGFEYVNHTMGYHYFKAETSDATQKMVKGEKQRRIERYHQLSIVMLMIGALNLMIYGINMVTHLSNNQMPGRVGLLVGAQLNLLCAVIMAIIYLLLRAKGEKVAREEGEGKTFSKYEKVVKVIIMMMLGIVCIGALFTFAGIL